MCQFGVDEWLLHRRMAAQSVATQSIATIIFCQRKNSLRPAAHLSELERIRILELGDSAQLARILSFAEFSL